jgi:hypothetical protein
LSPRKCWPERMVPDCITGQGMPGAETDIHAFVWCSDDQ